MDSLPKALITDIQRFSLHDGPGMRTTFFFKGCPLRCQWCANPETQSASPELFFSHSKCVACGMCANACPEGCINVGGVAVINRNACRECFQCVGACPTTALSRKGRFYTPRELLNIAMSDKLFYDRSGGGITASGGEPLMQSEAVAELFKLAKGEGLHTAIETSGHVPWNAFDRVLPYCDLIHFDIKHPNDATHRALTGVGTRLIHENLRALAAIQANVIVRAPMIPRRNTDAGSVMALAELLRPLRFPVEFLPFHQLGQGKFAALGRDYALKGESPLKERDIAWAIDLLEAEGINVIR